MKQMCQIFLVACIFSLAVFAQNPRIVNDQQRQADQMRQSELDRQRSDADLQNRINNLRQLDENFLRLRKESLRTSREWKKIKEIRERRAVMEKAVLPSPEDAARYEAFLQQPKTGLFRLFPDLNCSKIIVRADGNCADSIPGTWFYSFRQRDHSNELLFDIHLKDGNLIGNSFFSQALPVNLGDVPVENISLAASGMKFLTDFKPETERKKVNNQSLRIAQGIESEGYKYASSIKAAENTTYAARLIAYRNESAGINVSPEERMKVVELQYDRRVDIILAFRVIRKSEDGKLTLVWKELQTKNAPKITYEKREK